jgi:hypothetical protein
MSLSLTNQNHWSEYIEDRPVPGHRLNIYRPATRSVSHPPILSAFRRMRRALASVEQIFYEEVDGEMPNFGNKTAI